MNIARIFLIVSAITSCSPPETNNTHSQVSVTLPEPDLKPVNALERCDSGDGPCSAHQYDQLCSRGENWACDWKEDARAALRNGH